jgi:hypothetical protein
MARWQEQESGAKFQYGNTSSKNGEEMSEERLSFIAWRGKLTPLRMRSKCQKPSTGRESQGGRAHHLRVLGMDRGCGWT